MGSEIELEEVSTIIATFLKRFRLAQIIVQSNLLFLIFYVRNTYEVGADGKVSATDKDGKEGSAQQTGGGAARKANGVDIYDIYSVPTKASASSVLEFILECYFSQWQSVLRNSEYLLLLYTRNLYVPSHLQATSRWWRL